MKVQITYTFTVSEDADLSPLKCGAEAAISSVMEHVENESGYSLDYDEADDPCVQEVK